MNERGIVTETPSQIAQHGGSNANASVTANLAPWVIAVLCLFMTVMAFARADDAKTTSGATGAELEAVRESQASIHREIETARDTANRALTISEREIRICQSREEGLRSLLVEYRVPIERINRVMPSARTEPTLRRSK